MLGTLFLANQTKFAVGPTEALGMINHCPPHQYLRNRDAGNRAGGADFLALLTKFATGFTRDNMGREKQTGSVGKRHRPDALTGADFDAATAPTASGKEVVFFQRPGRTERVGAGWSG